MVNKMQRAEKKELQTHEKITEQGSQDMRVSLDELLSPSVIYDCVGKISHIDEDTKAVYVDFKGNPAGSPVAAKLARPFTLNDLEKAINHVLDIKLEFENHDVGKPVITDVFYSIIKNANQKQQKLQDIHIRGKRIIIDGETEIVIKSGEVSTTYSAQTGKLVAKAVDMKSEALHKNEIRGAAIKLN